jgi:RNA polymerase sigma factor (sigma-70 family)
MAGSQSDSSAPLPGGERFATTHWSVVLQASDTPSPQSQAALDRLCRAYWYPLYAFIRRQGRGPEEAQDLTQEFFAHLLESGSFSRADPRKGRFRSFLLGALKHFLVNEWQHEHRLKRGGGYAFFSMDDIDPDTGLATELADELTPEMAYERRWAEAVLVQVLVRLRAEFAAGGQAARFEALKVFLPAGQEPASYAEVAAQLGLSEAALKSAIYRLRQRYGELIRAEIANTVASPAEVEDELRHLFAVLCG